MAKKRTEPSIAGGQPQGKASRPNGTDPLHPEEASESAASPAPTNPGQGAPVNPDKPPAPDGGGSPASGKTSVEVNQYVDNCDMGWC